MSFSIDINKYKNRNCPICKSSSKSEKLITPLLRGGLSLKVPVFTSKCDACNLRYQSPTIGEEDLNYIYSNLYVGDLARQKRRFSIEKKRRKRSALSFSNLLDSQKCLNVVEVGCSSGYNLMNMMESYPSNKYSGYDLDVASVEFGRSLGINLKSTNFFDSKEKYDIIFLNHVLEHINDPTQFLEDLLKRLEKNGKIIINVPDSEVGNEIPSGEHANYFSGLSIKEMMKSLDGFIESIVTEVIDPGDHEVPEIRVHINPFKSYVDVNHTISNQSFSTGTQNRIGKDKRKFLRKLYDQKGTSKEERKHLSFEYKKVAKGRKVSEGLLGSKLYVIFSRS